jgi:hypothetical protein
MSGPSILGGGGTNIISMANSLLDNGRAIFARNGGPGMSASSRQKLESFFYGASSLFNQLYTRAENSEVSNNITILALRAKHEHNVAEGVFESTTKGTNVDTTA